MRNVNLIVTCTSRKTRTPVRGFRLRDLREKSLSVRAHRWIEKLRANGSENESHVEAFKLYCGEYWSIVRELQAVARKSEVCIRFWICSAGYGLITPDSEVRSYSATFSPEEGDCVTRGFEGGARKAAAQEWWRQIAMWTGPEGNRVRSLTSLAHTYPRTPLVVVASPDYLHALEKDLNGALDVLSDPDLLLIVSAGTRSFGKFSDNLVPCDARLQALVGGTRGSLNIRIAKLIFERCGKGCLGVERVSAQMGRLLKRQPRIENYRRRAASDKEIQAFIRTQAYKSGLVVSRSALLRRFRDSGKACEQSRFASLYRQMVIDEKVA